MTTEALVLCICSAIAILALLSAFFISSLNVNTPGWLDKSIFGLSIVASVAGIVFLIIAAHI